MKLDVTEEAVTCLKEEWGFEAGNVVRVYIRYVSGGSDPLSLGIMKEKQSPQQDRIAIAVNRGGMTFYIDENDRWYLQERDVKIDTDGQEIQFALD